MDGQDFPVPQVPWVQAKSAPCLYPHPGGNLLPALGKMARPESPVSEPQAVWT